MPTHITPDALMGIARQAAGDYIAKGENLTTAVVKHASASHLPLTEEHVRRICEMTYHDAYERAFHQKRGSMDRYISFDPPDAVQCAKELKAMAVEKKASAPQTGKQAGPIEFLKAASAMAGLPERQKYQPVNAYLATVLTPDVVKVASQDNWHNPYGDAVRLQQQIREAARKVQLDTDSAVESSKVAMAHLVGQADHACKNGAAVSDVLDLCLHAAGSETSTKIAHDIVCEIAEVLTARGYDVSSRTKTADYRDANLSHPLAVQFAKVAALHTAAACLNEALTDLKKDLDYANRNLCGVR